MSHSCNGAAQQLQPALSPCTFPLQPGAALKCSAREQTVRPWVWHAACTLQVTAIHEPTRMQAPVFGSNFGTQGGFAAFKGVDPPATSGGGEEGGEDAEEECKAEFTPLVQLEEVEVNTGEENEESLLELCAASHRCRPLELANGKAQVCALLLLAQTCVFCAGSALRSRSFCMRCVIAVIDPVR